MRVRLELIRMQRGGGVRGGQGQRPSRRRTGRWVRPIGPAPALPISVPEVLPVGRQHDGWDGAAGAELRDEPYMPYPHRWDRTLTWCRLAHASHRHGRPPLNLA